MMYGNKYVKYMQFCSGSFVKCELVIRNVAAMRKFFLSWV